MIKEELGISKSTLSGWLKDLPLSDKRISELQSNSQIRIEKSRITKQKKKDGRYPKIKTPFLSPVMIPQTAL